MNKKFESRDFDKMIEKTVFKARRKKITKSVSVSFIILFVGFVSSLNFSDRFYAFALDNPYLKTIAEHLRFTDIFEESEKIEIERETFTLNLLQTSDTYTVSEKTLELNHRDGFYLVYSQSEGEMLYFDEYEKTEGLSDLRTSIWSYNLETEQFSNIFSFGEYDAEGLFVNYKVIDDLIYVAITRQHEDGSYFDDIRIIKNNKVVKEDTSLTMVLNYHQNGVNFFKDGSDVIYSTLNKHDEAYCYEINNAKFKCYSGELKPNQIPILKFTGVSEDKYIFTETTTDLQELDNGVGPSDIKQSIVIFDKQGNELNRVKIAYHQIVVEDNLILQHQDNTYSVFHMDSGRIQTFSNMTELFYGLQEIGIKTIAFELKEISSNYSHLASNNPYFFEDDLKFLTLPSIKKQVIVFSDEEKHQLNLFEINFK